MTGTSDRFVSFGPEMIRQSEDYKTKVREISTRICDCRSEEMRLAAWWRRPLIWWRIEREIQKEVGSLLPPGAMYFAGRR